MIKPFLEISIEQTFEEKLSILELIKKIGKAYKLLYKKDFEIFDLEDKSYVRIDFKSIRDFEKIYESSFSFYVYAFENFLDKNEDFKSIFQNKKEKKRTGNYIVLRYKTNYVNPIRQYLGFTTRVNKYFGAKVINEELEDGYLRFVHTKVDFEALLVPGDVHSGWEAFFKIKKIDLNHPQIKEFFNVIKKWESKYQVNL
ncbi:MAG: hypothetical protein ACTSPA_10305 [Promethearchaeota archaeon]